MGGNLPWNLVFAGVALAIIVEILQIPSLPFAVGLYLPIHLSVPMMAGGVIKWAATRGGNEESEGQRERIRLGTLYASGLIAGEGIVGILLAIFTVTKINGISLGGIIDLSQWMYLGNAGGIVAFLGLIVTFFVALRRKI